MIQTPVTGEKHFQGKLYVTAKQDSSLFSHPGGYLSQPA